MTKTVMTPTHPNWREFRQHLNERSNLCVGDPAKPEAVRLLSAMPDVDIVASIAYFENHGGYCDCEILFNVAD